MLTALLVSPPWQPEAEIHVELSGLTPARRLDLAEEYRELGYIVEEVD